MPNLKSNNDIALLFEEIADILEIQAQNPFRIRAYRDAARELKSLSTPVADMLERGDDLSKLPTIGDDLAAKIEEIVNTDHCRMLDELHRQVPVTLIELLRLPGLGPKRVNQLHQRLGITSPQQLNRAARDGLVRTLPGFGEKTELAILAALESRHAQPERFTVVIATQYATALRAYLAQAHGVSDVAIAGSYRRCRDTIGDIDILVAADDGKQVVAYLAHYDQVQKVISSGNTRSTVILKSGMQVDLRVVANESFGAALVYFTGSKAHNIAIRKLGQQRKLKINEYGVFKANRCIAGKSEESVYASIGLPYIEPELRENRGEIEAAAANKLPNLVKMADLQGDLHSHSKASDGHHSLREMAQGAAQIGLTYLAVTEHSPRLAMAHGLSPRQLRQQLEQIDKLNEELRNITLLKGIEVDILEDGSLDLPDSILCELDLVVAAVHSNFNLSRDKQTKRILHAMDNPHVNILAHPSGRLIGKREPYSVDMLRIIRHAHACGCYLELNAQPQRLDLLDTHCRMAKEEGVLVAINSDAHSVQDFDNLRYGIGQARRGWLEKKDVLNTCSLSELKKRLKHEG